VADRFKDAIRLHKMGRLGDAETIYREIIAQNPRHVDALHMLGCAYMQVGQHDRAREFMERALSYNSLNPEIMFNLGCSYMMTRHLDEAERLFKNVIALQPKRADAWNNLGYCYNVKGRLEECEPIYRRVVEINPALIETWCNLANLLKDLGRFDEALEVYKQAQGINPSFPTVWRGEALTLKYPDAMPMAERFRLMKRGGEQMTTGIKPLPERIPARREKIRIGWHTSDLYLTHPVARNLAPFFEHRDRTEFEFYVYSDVKMHDQTTDWFKERAEGWRPVLGMKDKAVADLIRADQIDVMIYLAGRYDDNRPQVAAWRAAPLNVAMFDVATSGIPAMDYFVVDRKMVGPKESFTERLLKLPGVYVHDPIPVAPEPAPPPCIEAGYVTFGCFNNPIKIGPRTLALWKRVLEGVPGSRLLLHYKAVYAQPSTRERILKGLEGIDPKRVEFSFGDRTGVQHLTRYAEVDIALDPVHVTGSTTTFEALYQGVPVITLRGETLTSRWSAAMVERVWAMFVARNEYEYVAIAQTAATDWPWLKHWRAFTRQKLLKSALCDGRGTVRYFERAMKAIWQKKLKESA
jgi:predicted O-linked N-acetylglucosamine transferase (SPINDLY family)